MLTGVYLTWEAEPHVALAYAGILRFALVCLGEHHVIDLLARAALAAGVAALRHPLAPLARRVGAAWRRLEPPRR